MAIKSLWVKTYRPSTLDGYVFRDPAQKQQIQSWIKDQSIPHLIFSGSAGLGKTTLAKILINQLGIQEYDVKEINASRNNGVDYIRDTIEGFVQTMPFGDFKIVLLDEADYLSPNAQAILRNLMETYEDTARFILTCNYPHKIIAALHSRCQGFHIDKIDQTEFTARMAEILITEEIDFDLDTLDAHVSAVYPDLRKCINNCQLNSTTGTLLVSTGADGGSSEYRVEAVKLFKEKKFRQARELICKNVGPDEMDGLIEWTYNNLNLWGSTEEQKDDAIKIIRYAAINASFVACPEINIAGLFVELSEIDQGE